MLSSRQREVFKQSINLTETKTNKQLKGEVCTSRWLNRTKLRQQGLLDLGFLEQSQVVFHQILQENGRNDFSKYTRWKMHKYKMHFKKRSQSEETKNNSVLFLSSMEQAGTHKIDFPEFIMLLTQKHNSHHKGDKRQFVLEPNMNDHDRKTQVYSNPVFQQQSNFIKYL